MKNIRCKDVNRNCEFGDEYTITSNPTEETRQVEVRRILSDSIWDSVPTGRWFRRVTTLKKCKYCGYEEEVNSEIKYV